MIELKRAQKVAAEVVKQLSPYCQYLERAQKVAIEVVGSVRRRKPQVHDIDFVLIPSDLWELHNAVLRLGPVRMSGSKLMRVMFNGTQVDIYVASEESWATLLLIRTGSAQNNIRLATLAKVRGWRLAASGDGLFNEKGERIAGDTEESIYEALGLRYQAPEERG